MNQEKVGKFIAGLRKEKKLTQEGLANKLNINSRSISRWENGKCMPDISLLVPLSKILGVTVNDLLNGEKMANQDSFEENIVNVIAKVDKTNKKYKNCFKWALIVVITLPLLSLTMATIDYNRVKSHKEPFFKLFNRYVNVSSFDVCIADSENVDDWENIECPEPVETTPVRSYSGFGYSLISCDFCEKQTYILPFGIGTYPNEYLSCDDVEDNYRYEFKDGKLAYISVSKVILTKDIEDTDAFLEELNSINNIAGCTSNHRKVNNLRHEIDISCEINEILTNPVLSSYGFNNLFKNKTRNEIVKEYKKQDVACRLYKH